MSILPHDDLKERVRDAIDIVDLVGSYVSLRRSGRALMGLCPWHEDSRPSLQVNPERQTFRCWVCNVGGDAFSFLMKAERLEFPEALEQLAQRSGIDIPRGRAGFSFSEKSQLYSAIQWASDRFHECLLASQGTAVRTYLTERGLSSETIETFAIGFAPDEWDWLLKQSNDEGISTDVMKQAGLVVERQDRSGFYDRFRGRVIFPIRDPQNRCVAFGGRILPGASPDAAKYINSPETPLFSKSSMLYGLDSARQSMAQSRRAVVVEGYTDCLAARQAGIHDVVAVLGTALGERHAKLLRRYADRIVLVLDGDDAGRRRADEILDVLLSEPIDVRIVRLPTGVDPCEFLTIHGREAFESLLASAGDPLEYRMDEALAKMPLGSGDEAALIAVESVLKALSRVSSQAVNSSQRLLREDQILGRLSRRFTLSREALRIRLLSLRSEFSSRQRPVEAVQTQHAPPVPSLSAWDREILEVLVSVPESAGIIVREFSSDQIESSVGRTVFDAARKLDSDGRRVALGDLLLELPDPQIQSLLVDIDDSGSLRCAGNPSERLGQLLEALRRRSAETMARTHAKVLTSTRLEPLAEAELLEQLVAQRRAAQGMTDPKDG